MKFTAEQTRAIFDVCVKNRGEAHVCTPESCPEGGSYYITTIDGNNWWIMAGPYPTHAAARADVTRACDIACKHSSRAWFYAWGTCRIEGATEPGNLNKAGLL